MSFHAVLTAGVLFGLCVIPPAAGQGGQDTTINNLVHPDGYRTCTLGELGNVNKFGSGPKSLILIPGLGFDASVFDDFIEVNRDRYTMYAVTLAGYGDTPAPPMPPEGTSYGEQSWNRGAIDGLVRLIEKEKLNKPVVVGHFVQGTQMALRLAIDHPEKVGGVVVMGGPAKFIAVRNGRVRDFSLDTMIMFTDQFTGPRWFKHMEKKFFDDNNFMPAVYSLDSARGTELWQYPVRVPLPVMVRYASEYFACDVRAELQKIRCPVLVLRVLFDDRVLNDPINNYVKPQFIDSWNDVSSMNRLIQVKDISNASAFVWKDKPEAVYSEIERFVGSDSTGQDIKRH